MDIIITIPDTEKKLFEDAFTYRSYPVNIPDPEPDPDLNKGTIPNPQSKLEYADLKILDYVKEVMLAYKQSEAARPVKLSF